MRKERGSHSHLAPSLPLPLRLRLFHLSSRLRDSSLLLLLDIKSGVYTDGSSPFSKGRDASTVSHACIYRERERGSSYVASKYLERVFVCICTWRTRLLRGCIPRQRGRERVGPLLDQQISICLPMWSIYTYICVFSIHERQVSTPTCIDICLPPLRASSLFSLSLSFSRLSEEKRKNDKKTKLGFFSFHDVS